MSINLPIEIKNLHWEYGKQIILDNIGFKIEKNKFYSIIGPNGAGKTTLLKLMANILNTDKKTVYVYNDDVKCIKINELAKKMSLVPQNTNVDFEFTVLEVVLMGRTPYLKRFQTESTKDTEIIKQAMKMTNTWYLKDKKINEISGGERQRVIVARAIAQQTDILLLDEPISQLDIHHQVELLDMIKKINTQNNVTIISVLHDLNMAASYSDYLILLDNKKIYSIGTPEEVITENNIKKVYNMEVYMIKHPYNNKPYIIPRIG